MRAVKRFVSSRFFFGLVISLFFLQAFWVVGTLAYPGIFDESYHLGIISLYAKQWSPFIVHQSASTYGLGDLTRDPSFLYHYLMSFPYRIVAHFTSSQMIQVITLRSLSVLLFGASLLFFQKTFKTLKVPAAIINCAVFFFVLVPVVPFLAAQINYDNLVMFCAALTFWLVARFHMGYSQGHFSPTLLLVSFSVALFGAMSQFEFLPVLAATGVYYAVVSSLTYRRYIQKKKASVGKLPQSLGKQIGLWGLVISTVVLFSASYGVNVLRYHTPTPSCDQVLSVESCLEYYAFNRNYTVSQIPHVVNDNPIVFSLGWVYRLFETSFYTALNGPVVPLQVLPLPLPVIATMLVLIPGVALLIVYAKRLYKEYPGLLLLCGFSLFYLLILWQHNFSDYLTVGIKVGINGRYLFPAILPLVIAIGISWAYVLRSHTKFQGALLVVMACLFLNGGGITLYVISSTDSWWWGGHYSIHVVATAMKRLVAPLVVNFPLFR